MGVYVYRLSLAIFLENNSSTNTTKPLAFYIFFSIYFVVNKLQF